MQATLAVLYALRAAFASLADRRLSFLFVLRASGEQFQQHGIALALEFFNRTVAGLFQNPFEKRLLNLGAEFRDFPEIFPPCRQRARELRQEMLHPALTAAQVEQKIGPHDTPPQSGPPTHRCIRVCNIEYALLDEVHDFAIKGGLQAIRYVADNLFADMDRFLADRLVKGDRSVQRFPVMFSLRQPLRPEE